MQGNRLKNLPDPFGISSEAGILNYWRGAQGAWGMAGQICRIARPLSSPHTWSWSPPHCPAWSSAQTAGVLCHWTRNPTVSSGHWGRLQRKALGFCWSWWSSVAGGGSTWSPGPYSVALRTAPVFKKGTGQLMRAWNFGRRAGQGQHEPHQSKPTRWPKSHSSRTTMSQLQEPVTGVNMIAPLVSP